MNTRFSLVVLCIVFTCITGRVASVSAAVIFQEDFSGTYTFTNDRPVQVRPGDEFWTVDDSRAGAGFVFCGNYADQIEFRTESLGDCRWFFSSEVLVTGDYASFFYEMYIGRHDYGKRNWIGYHIPVSINDGAAVDRDDAGLYFEFDFSLTATNAGIWLADEKILPISVTAADRLGVWRIMYTPATKEVEVFRDGVSKGSVIESGIDDADVFDEIGFGGHLYTNSSTDCRIYYDNLVIKSVPPLQSGDNYWDASDDTGLQAGDGSWDNSTVMWNESDSGSGSRDTWISGNTAHFAGDGYSEATVNEGVAADSIIVHDGAACYIIPGTNSAGDIIGTIDLMAGTGGIATGIVANGDLIMDTAVDKAGAQVWSVAENMIFEIIGGISGSGDLIKEGPGVISFNQGWWAAENNFSGKMIINQGHADIAVGMWSGGSGIGQGLVINPGASATALQPHIGGQSGRPVSIDHGILTMNYESYLREITMTAGTINGNAEIRMYSWVNTLAADETATISCPLNVFNNALFEIENGAASPDLSVNTIFGNYNITKGGPGTMIINNVCSNTGDVTVNDGTMIMQSASNVYSHSGITSVGGAGSAALVLNCTHSTPSNYYFIEFDGRLSGNGTIIGTQAGLVTVFGQLSPGESVGTITTSNDLLMLEESSYRWEVDGALSDTMVVGGTLAFSNEIPASITIIVSELAGGILQETNTLFTFGSLDDSLTNALKFNDDWQSTAPSLTAPPELIIDGNALKVVLIPEPAAMLFLAALALMAGSLTRRT